MAPPKLLQRYHMRRGHAECMPKYHPNRSDSLLVTDGTYPSSDYDRKHHAIPQVAHERKDTKPYVSFCLVALPVSLSIDARCCLWSNSFDGNVGVMSLYRWFRYKCYTPSGRRNGASYDRAAVWRNKMRTHGTLILALGMWLILQRSLRCHSRTFLCRMGYANRTHACNGSCRHNADRNRNTLQQITPTHTFRLQFIVSIMFVTHWGYSSIIRVTIAHP